jgi:hypothetical protein
LQPGQSRPIAGQMFAKKTFKKYLQSIALSIKFIKIKKALSFGEGF